MFTEKPLLSPNCTFGPLFLLAACAGLIFAPTLPASGKNLPPNIVLLFADDLGWSDVGIYGSDFYETPHLDRLAEQGARFSDAYATCKVCSPTRASLMTGQWPPRSGITDFISAGNRNSPENWTRNTILLPAPNADRLDHAVPTIASTLRENGYATFFAGKWHLGPEGWWPEDHGFDVNKGGHHRGGPYGGDKYFSPYGNPRLDDGPKGEHLPDRLAAETEKFMEQHKDQPFFALLSFYSVHTPLIAREDLMKKYEAKRERLGLEPKWGREGTRDVRLVQEHVIYAAMVEAMDLAVGRVLSKLEELGLADNTLVVFASDNGGLSTSEGWPTSSLPLRAGKGWTYEGGIRTPLLVRWPGKIEPGIEMDTPVATHDLFPTFIDAAGIEPPHGHKIDGLSMLPLFRGEALAERSLYWHYPHYGNQGSAPSAAVRRGNWKLIEFMEDRRLELYDLTNDIGENNDLYRKHPELADDLHAELRAWQKSVGAKFPSPNPNYNPLGENGRHRARPLE